MDEATLTRELSALAPPQLDEARTRATMAIGSSLGVASSTSAKPLRAKPARRPSLRLAIVAGLLALAVLGLTPPGQAAVGWLGERVGIGEPGGPPTLEGMRKIIDLETSAEGAPAYVLADGPGPDGAHYELVTYEAKAQEERCFELDVFNRSEGSGGSTHSDGCERLPGSGLQPLEPPLPDHGGLQATMGGNAGGEHPYRYVAGRVSEDVDSVRVEFDGEPVKTEMTPIPGGLFAELGIDRPFKFFVAFSDGPLRGGDFEITAEGSDGNPVAHESLEAGSAPVLTPAKIERLEKAGDRRR